MVAKLTKTEIAKPEVTMQGSIVADKSTTPPTLQLSVNGSIIPYRCLDPLVLAEGDTVAVTFVGDVGQYDAWVLGRLGNQFRPATGTVVTVPPSSPTITVTGADGIDYTATFGSNYTPTVGHNVELLWAASTPYVVAQVGSTPAPPVGPVGPPPVTGGGGGPTVGTTPFSATDSGTYTPGYGWDRFAQQNRQVYKGGAGYGGPSAGSWFYGGSPQSLAGRTITAVAFRIGTRLYVGSYNSTVEVGIYGHTSPGKPGSDVSRTVGPFNVNIAPNQPAFEIDLPAGVFGPILQAGGGISITGEPYAGFNGINVDPSSGSIRMAWSM